MIEVESGTLSHLLQQLGVAWQADRPSFHTAGRLRLMEADTEEIYNAFAGYIGDWCRKLPLILCLEDGGPKLRVDPDRPTHPPRAAHP